MRPLGLTVADPQKAKSYQNPWHQNNLTAKYIPYANVTLFQIVIK